ncbi:MAG: hypothetical protein Q4Q53_03110 [Methanocorpusculum sp.]|nr:hypothetical protein [Methanocorpusculum sp.]
MKDPVSMRNLYLGGFLLLIAGIIVILLVFSATPQIEAKEPVYSNGILTTEFTYSGDQPLTAWIQYEVFKEDGLFSSTSAAPMQSFIADFGKGQTTISKMPVILNSGKYKIFIYILEKEEPHKRITGFIKYVDVI